MASSCIEEPDVTNTTVLFTVALTFAVTCCFLVSKTTLDRVRQRMSRVAVVVIGAGPVGLTSILIAARSGKVSRIIVFEERCRHDLVGRTHQIAIDAKMTAFLQSLGVDFDNIEGCREKGCFFTRSGVFLEYMLSIIQRLDVPIDLRLNCKVRAPAKSSRFSGSCCSPLSSPSPCARWRALQSLFHFILSRACSSSMPLNIPSMCPIISPRVSILLVFPLSPSRQSCLPFLSFSSHDQTTLLATTTMLSTLTSFKIDCESA
ncbi:hypothetical protein NP493_5g17091 [Ridgeia piscesae]|uniref:Uncharacterized protein n=1 Tax=Ridgeia piscesae TaxID=27915 RepID=A0AAD9PFK3_RIDPI|nr:hypothetical protein NP493_5g17091 [Ridgeia piscesae]